MTRIDWSSVVATAATIARGYSTPPTLRQLFYRLVAAGTIPNTQVAYKSLSNRTSKARRADTFPGLSDGTRHVAVAPRWDDPADALQSIADQYRLDRTAGQKTQVWVTLEKATLERLAVDATDRFGVPVLALRGYGSQTIIDYASEWMENDGRRVEMLYVGDFDPSGEDIERDLVARLSVPVTFIRLAVTPEQVTTMALPPMVGKATDTRAAGFVAKHGRLVQVEAEAIDPGVLAGLVTDAVEARTDFGALEAVEEEERAGREHLATLV